MAAQSFEMEHRYKNAGNWNQVTASRSTDVDLRQGHPTHFRRRCSAIDTAGLPVRAVIFEAAQFLQRAKELVGIGRLSENLRKLQACRRLPASGFARSLRRGHAPSARRLECSRFPVLYVTSPEDREPRRSAENNRILRRSAFPCALSGILVRYPTQKATQRRIWQVWWRGIDWIARSSSITSTRERSRISAPTACCRRSLILSVSCGKSSVSAAPNPFQNFGPFRI